MYPAAYYGFTGYIFYVCNNEGYTKTKLPGKPDPMLYFLRSSIHRPVFSNGSSPVGLARKLIIH